MKKGTYALIIFLIFFLLVVAILFSFFYFEIKRPPAIKAQSYLEIELSGGIQDFYAPDLFTSLFLGAKPYALHDLWLNLKKAKADERVRCVLVRLGYLQCDWAKISEIREAILDFRKSGKKVYVYIEEALDFDKEYYLATACDKIILHPLGWLGINGIGGYVPFFKKALEKLGIQAEFEHVEEYKTAYNMFTEEKFTQAHKEMMEAIYGDIFAEYVRAIASARRKTEEDVKKLIDHGMFQGDSALKAGIVDDLLYEDELETLLRDKGKKLSRIRLEEYARIKPSSLGLDRGKKIALIYAMGPIFSGESVYQTIGSKTVSRWIKRARENDAISAIIIRVDSPGGSPVASDVIWREVALAKKEKPVVVSMSDVAGSGGYWISMAAHKIVAQPQTLTGSIGVLAGKINFAGLYQKLGVTAEKLTYGQRADMFSTFRGMTPEEKELLKNEILWVYDKFLTKAAEGRNMSKEDVHKVGRGRVWTGNQAKEIHLVDEIGGLQKALEVAKQLAGIPPAEQVSLIVWPRKTSLWGTFFGRREVGTSFPLKPQLERFLSSWQLLEKERVWALMTFGLAAD